MPLLILLLAPIFSPAILLLIVLLLFLYNLFTG